MPPTAKGAASASPPPRARLERIDRASRISMPLLPASPLLLLMMCADGDGVDVVDDGADEGGIGGGAIFIVVSSNEIECMDFGYSQIMMYYLPITNSFSDYWYQRHRANRRQDIGAAIFFPPFLFHFFPPISLT